MVFFDKLFSFVTYGVGDLSIKGLENDLIDIYAIIKVHPENTLGWSVTWFGTQILQFEVDLKF